MRVHASMTREVNVLMCKVLCDWLLCALRSFGKKFFQCLGEVFQFTTFRAFIQVRQHTQNVKRMEKLGENCVFGDDGFDDGRVEFFFSLFIFLFCKRQKWSKHQDTPLFNTNRHAHRLVGPNLTRTGPNVSNTNTP